METTQRHRGQASRPGEGKGASGSGALHYNGIAPLPKCYRVGSGTTGHNVDHDDEDEDESEDETGSSGGKVSDDGLFPVHIGLSLSKVVRSLGSIDPQFGASNRSLEAGSPSGEAAMHDIQPRVVAVHPQHTAAGSEHHRGMHLVRNVVAAEGF